MQHIVAANLDRLTIAVDVAQRRAQTSPRRMPVVVTSHTSVPQSSSIANAAANSRAASAGDGGEGSGALTRGRCATRAGFVAIQSQRTAAESVPLMIEWI
jgi:hypothetical protein